MESSGRFVHEELESMTMAEAKAPTKASFSQVSITGKLDCSRQVVDGLLNVNQVVKMLETTLITDAEMEKVRRFVRICVGHALSCMLHMRHERLNIIPFNQFHSNDPVTLAAC
jgi:hypothetical protein